MTLEEELARATARIAQLEGVLTTIQAVSCECGKPKARQMAEYREPNGDRRWTRWKPVPDFNDNDLLRLESHLRKITGGNPDLVEDRETSPPIWTSINGVQFRYVVDDIPF